MATENVKAFLDSLKEKEELQRDIKKNMEGKGPDEVIKSYSELAKRLGQDVSEADLAAFFKEKAEALKARTDAAIEKVEELSLDDLQAVAGGMHDKCANTYTDRENCYLLDGCDQVIFPYDYYKCQHNEIDAHCGSDATQDCEGLIW